MTGAELDRMLIPTFESAKNLAVDVVYTANKPD